MQYMDLDFFKEKKVFITGHTGFKGTWLCRILLLVGADVTGYALPAPTEPNLFSMAGLEGRIYSEIGDIRDLEHLKRTFEQVNPEIVIHLAAQPLVIEGYRDPVGTYSTNVMGTVHILECVRQSASVRSFLNVTTDKVYHNNEWVWGYRESEPLDGFDPYSNSKSCSELVTHCYRNSYLGKGTPAVSTARAGNVIGGGDFAENRIIPDCIRAAMNGETIAVRNPYSIRPYQHVLEPLFAYLMICEKQYQNAHYSGYYNVGPDESDCLTTGELTDLFCSAWGEGQTWENISTDGPHEASFLKLDCSKLRSTFGWKPRWSIRQAIEKTVEWAKVYQAHGDIPACMDAQIREFINGEAE